MFYDLNFVFMNNPYIAQNNAEISQ